ncbi:hypothetical protein D0863_00787 [Hortaea werneckii]|uniref:TAFII28-like protein domain-containing protein n=1 Tax=Hortaea werneckii TaxID=91943 RepID=A0A3M7ENZ2_HORWE|nr:hypothetical protein D0863_00787 [Hortaea werneckii]
MASPPSYGGATSPPPSGGGLALPRQRPALALPGQVPSRKPSVASATAGTPSAHPLRQTSFPPSDSLEAQHALAEDHLLARSQYSPSAADSDAGGAGLEGFSDDENDVSSTVDGPTGDSNNSGPANKKRKRGTEKKSRGRPPKTRAGSVSLVNGEDGGPGRGAKSTRDEDGDAEGQVSEEEEDEEDAAGKGDGTGRAPLYDGGQMSADQLTEERERKRLFYEGTTEDQRSRLAAFQRSKLRTADVRKLVNSVLGQSVPQNVVLVVGAYAKMFAGMLIEDAREVQAEWKAAEPKRPDGEDNRAYKRMRRSKEEAKRVHDEKQEGNGDKGGETQTTDSTQPNGTQPADGEVKEEPTSPSKDEHMTNGDVPDPDADITDPGTGGAGGLGKDIEECDRGPLLPDHLREALRRYKKKRAGGAVGFTGMSLEGRENTAAKTGGRRLFR